MKSSKANRQVPKASRRGASKAPTANSSKPKRKSAPVSKTLARYQTPAPRLVSSNSSVTVTHREFISDVAGSTAFTVLSYPVNPGRDTTFNWLSDLAARYEKYQFQKLCFLYEPRCPTTIAGTVVLALDYDALDSTPTSKQNVYSYSHTAQSAAWDECVMMVDPTITRARGPLFTRVGAAPSTSDLKTYDLGNLLLCTSGFTGTDICGELFVEYTVVLSIPQVQSNIQYATYSGTAGVAVGAIFGSAPLTLTGNLDATLTATTATFQQNWRGYVTMNITGVDLTDVGSVGSTATVSNVSNVIDAAATSETKVFLITALRGQTFIPLPAATSVSACSFIFAPRT